MEEPKVGQLVPKGIIDEPAPFDSSPLADCCNKYGELFSTLGIISLSCDSGQQSDQLSHHGKEFIPSGSNQSLALDILVVLVQPIPNVVTRSDASVIELFKMNNRVLIPVSFSAKVCFNSLWGEVHDHVSFSVQENPFIKFAPSGHLLAQVGKWDDKGHHGGIEKSARADDFVC